jgi:hypothetical protein
VNHASASACALTLLLLSSSCGLEDQHDPASHFPESVLTLDPATVAVQSLDQGDPANFRLLRDGAGRFHVMTAVVDVGLHADDVLNSTAVEAALRSFLTTQNEAFASGGGFDIERVKFKQAETIDHDTVTIRATQLDATGTPLYRSDVVFLLSPKTGDLWAITGVVYPDLHYETNDAFYATEAITAALQTVEYDVNPADLEVSESDDGFQADAGEGQARITARRFAHPDLLEHVWEVVQADHTWLVSALTGEILASGRDVLHANKTVNLKRRNFTSVTDLGLTFTTNSTTSSTVGYSSDIWGTCHYEARYDATTGPFARVADMTGAPITGSQICTQTHTFGPQTTWDGNYRETDLLHWLKSSRTLATDVWSNVGGALSTTVVFPQVHGNAGTHCFNTNALACYNLGTHALVIVGTSAAAGYNVGVIFHEYGHHVHWSYNIGGNGCVSGSDESQSLRETFANAWSGITARHVFGEAMGYNVLNLGTSSKHWTGNGTQYSVSLPSNPCGQNFGNFFVQGIWETLWDVDCSDSSVNCNSDAAVNAANAVGWSTATAKMRLSRAMAYSAEVGSSGARTHQNFGIFMHSYLLNNVGYTVAENFRQIMNHHGTGL